MTQLTKYTLHEILGKGGYGTVYRATDNILKVERAIKILRPALVSDIEFVARFQREGQTAAQLEHPHIVPVYDLGEEQGNLFLVMKYLPGGSLKDYLTKHGHLPFEQVVALTRQIASALDYAHTQPEKLIHRDIKPGNILFEMPPGQNAPVLARLADFGFAKALAGSDTASLSNSGVMLGTPAYMAPEIWREKGVSPWTDIYSLACVVFEMITGKVLFTGDSAASVMTKHVMDAPQFPAVWPGDVPSQVGDVLAKALAKDPQIRYPRAGAFAQALENLLVPETPVVKPPARSAENPLSPANAAPPLPPAANVPQKAPTTTSPPRRPIAGKWLLTCGVLGFLALCALVVGGGALSYSNRCEWFQVACGTALPVAHGLTETPTKIFTPSPTITPTNLPTKTSTPSATFTQKWTITPTPTQTHTKTPLPTDVPVEEPPAYYIEEFDGSANSYYPDQYLYFVTNGPDEVDEDVYMDNGKLVFNIDTKDTYIYLYYDYWLYEDVRIGMQADNLGANSHSVSLFCRYDPDRGWIEFNIAGDGTYNILAYDALSGAGYTLLFNGGSTAINIGKKVNTYVAECIGDEIALYVNDIEVKTMTIPDAYQFIREGTVGFSVSSFSSLPVVVEMEWFGIEQP